MTKPPDTNKVAKALKEVEAGGLEARDKVEGTGIGLSVVKKIVESRGGKVWVESEIGAGAAFRFTWYRDW